MKKGISFSSGGKDSILALHLASTSGIEITSIMTMIPEDPESMLYHTHNVDLVQSIGDVIGVKWIPVSAPKADEKEALKQALSGIDADYLVTGGIASSYQKVRFDEVCAQAGMEHYAPLWGTSPKELYGRILELRMDVMIIAVAAYGLGEEWLGRHLDEDTVGLLLRRAERYRFNAVGEGGDLDTLVLDAPLYKRKLRPTKTIREWEGDRGRLVISGLDEAEK